MNIYKIRKTNPKTGRKRLFAYRMILKTRGYPQTVIQLSAARYTENDAQQLAGILGAIIDEYNGGQKVKPETVAFLDLFPDVKRRLIEKGFIAAVKEKLAVEIWEEYAAAKYPDFKEYTILHKEQARRRFFEFFAPDMRANELTKRHAFALASWLQGKIDAGRLAEATAATFISDVKTVFKWAKDEETLEKNPFEVLKKGATANPARRRYVEIGTLEKLLDACPSREWQTLLLLGRRLGLRIPSESNALKWADVDLENGAIQIHAPKTERHKNKGTRTAPLFPDLLEALRQLKDEQRRSGEQSPFVLPTVRGANINLRTAFERIIYNAGVEKWPRIFQNLRASAATDISETFGEQSEAAWVGHSPEIAKKHYLMITPETLAAAKKWNPRAA